MSASNAFVEGFADFWKAPSPDRLTDHLHPDVVLVRPLSPPRHGLGRPSGSSLGFWVCCLTCTGKLTGGAKQATWCSSSSG